MVFNATFNNISVISWHQPNGQMSLGYNFVRNIFKLMNFFYPKSRKLKIKVDTVSIGNIKCRTKISLYLKMLDFKWKCVFIYKK